MRAKLADHLGLWTFLSLGLTWPLLHYTGIYCARVCGHACLCNLLCVYVEKTCSLGSVRIYLGQLIALQWLLNDHSWRIQKHLKAFLCVPEPVCIYLTWNPCLLGQGRVPEASWQSSWRKQGRHSQPKPAGWRWRRHRDHISPIDVQTINKTLGGCNIILSLRKNDDRWMSILEQIKN